MKSSALRQGLNLFNLLFVASFMVLALYSAIGQQILPHISQYRINLEQFLSEQLNGDVVIRDLSAGMDILTPSLHIEGVTLHTDDRPNQPKVSIAAIDAVLDPRLSLINLTPVFQSVRLSGLYIHLDESSKSKTRLEKDDVELIKRFIDTLLLQHHVELNNVTIENERGSDTSTLFLKHLSMTGDGFHHLITGNISYGDEQKVNAGLRLYTEGSPFKLDDFYARGALDLPDVDVDYWVRKIFDISVFDQFSSSAQLRFEFKEGLLNYAKLNAASSQVSIRDGETVEAVNTEIWIKQKALNNWHFWLEKADFNLVDKPWAFNHLGLSLAKLDSGSRWQAYIEDMDLNYLQDFATSLDVVPDNINTLLDELSPEGQVKNLNVILQPNQDGELSITLASDLKQISTKARGGIPSIKNLNGVVAINNKSGRVQFDGRDMTLDFETIYDNPFHFLQGRGQVDWEISEHGFHLKGEGLSVALESVKNIRGGFQAWFYNDEQLEDKLELNLSMQDADIQAHKLLVPNLVSKDLKNWLNKSLINGSGRNGQFYLLTGLDERSISQTELSLNMSGGEISYLEQWPNVAQGEGHLLVRNDQVFVRLSSAKTLGGDAVDTQVVFDGIKSNRLWITAQISGKTAEGLEYFQKYPLAKVINNVAKQWQADGAHQTQLGLMVPLDDSEFGTVVDVGTRLIDTDLSITDVGLTFEGTAGHIEYRSSSALGSTGLSTHLWRQPFTLSIDSEVHEKGFSTDIGFKGKADVASLQSWLDLSLLNPISGVANVSGGFKISGQEHGFTGLQLESDLAGVALNLPEPYGKDATSITPLDLSLSLSDGQKLALKYNDTVNLAVHVKKGEIKAGQVYLGATEAYIPSEQGLEVFGHIPSLDVRQWQKVWSEIHADNPAKTQGVPLLRQARISTDALIIDHHKIEQVKVNINRSSGGYDMLMQAPLVKGLVQWKPESPVILDLDYIHWPVLTDESPSISASQLSDFSFESIPHISFDIDEIFIGATNYGAWSGQVLSEPHQLAITNLSGDIKKMKVAGDIKWAKAPLAQQADQTELNVIITSKDVGGIQKAWRSKPVVEAKDARVALNLNWNNNPLEIATDILNGNIQVNLKDGRFLEAGDTQGLSAFGILNFAAIGRRLRLDFSDVYQSGFHFDSVSGKMLVNNGLVKIVDTLDIRGPSAKFSASGTVDLNSKQLNQELSVTFPITSTLPFVAILAGFAPPVAASLFVGEQLVGDQIERITSATYRLTGSWDEPDLKLMKRFDNNIEGKQDRGFWYRMKDFFGLGDDQ